MGLSLENPPCCALHGAACPGTHPLPSRQRGWALPERIPHSREGRTRAGAPAEGGLRSQPEVCVPAAPHGSCWGADPPQQPTRTPG